MPCSSRLKAGCATPEALPPRLEAAQRVGKPVLLQEFGFHTQTSRLPDPHTEAEQAWYYQQILDLTEGAGVGWMFWTLHDLPEGPVPGGRSVERHLGVFSASGQAKPAVEVLLGERAGPPRLQNRLLKLLPFLGAALMTLLLLVAAGYGLTRYLGAARARDETL